ncbi:MAG: hypothetical protein DRQ51_01615 [Gammaproteobacteria bacterium]|nr:MAG: hypothetical protein DRQ51_01615 [Gammaproteobacteria bacterium]
MKFNPQNLPSVVGIALADILANGVAVILILIILSLVVKQHQAEVQIQQNKDMQVVMAQDILNKIIVNDLPSSSPAVLHDYNHKRNPQSPIIEMYDNFIRILGDEKTNPNLNLTITRNQLLQKNNKFELFLKSLKSPQKLLLRADIYSIRLYYLTMAAIKEQNLKIRHWHYNGEDMANARLKNKKQKNTKTNFTLDKQTETTEKPTEDKPDFSHSLPNNTDFDFDRMQNSPFDDRIPSDIGKQKRDSQNLSLSEALTQSFAKKRQQKEHGIKGFSNRKLKIKIAGEQGKAELSFKQKFKKLNSSQVSYERFMLNFLLLYLHQAQEIENKNKFFNFNIKDILQQMQAHLKDPLKFVNNSIYNQEVNLILRKIKSIRQTKQKKLQIYNRKKGGKNFIKLPFNVPIRGFDLYYQKNNKPYIFADNLLSLSLYPYNNFYQGIENEIIKNNILLVPIKIKNRNNWQVIALIDKNIEDISLGHIFAKINKNKLDIKNLENDLKINNQELILKSSDSKNYLSSFHLWLYFILFITFTIFFLIRRQKK